MVETGGVLSIFFLNLDERDPHFNQGTHTVVRGETSLGTEK